MATHIQKILVMGLPGAGKTTLATALARQLSAVHFNADEIRTNVCQDLGYTYPDRLTQARRMGWLCNQVVKAGHYVVADFICPTEGTRVAFEQGSKHITIFVDTIEAGRYDDTNQMFKRPTQYDYHITDYSYDIKWLADRIINGQGK